MSELKACNRDGLDGCSNGTGWNVNGKWFCANHWLFARAPRSQGVAKPIELSPELTTEMLDLVRTMSVEHAIGVGKFADHILAFVNSRASLSTYVLIEQWMNGTVTGKIIPNGVEAGTFAEAKDVVRQNLKKNLPDAKIERDDETALVFTTSDIFGMITDEPLPFLSLLSPESKNEVKP